MTADNRLPSGERGYVLLPASTTVPNGVLLHLETLFERAGENAGHHFREEPFARVVEIPAGDAGVFEPLARDAQVLEHVRRRLGADFELAALHARSMNPFALALKPPRPSPSLWACRVLWLLDDFQDEGAAALRVIPGSQLWPAGSETAFDEPAAVVLSAAAGSAIILDGRLWTAQGFNPGNRHLRMLCCDYEPRCS
jgi:hypothetical protein